MSSEFILSTAGHFDLLISPTTLICDAFSKTLLSVMKLTMMASLTGGFCLMWQPQLAQETVMQLEEEQPWMMTWPRMMRLMTEVLLMLVMAREMELVAQEMMTTEAMVVMEEDLVTMSDETEEEEEVVALALLRSCSNDLQELQEVRLELKQPQLLRLDRALEFQCQEL
jgi:hypothetical protein